MRHTTGLCPCCWCCRCRCCCCSAYCSCHRHAAGGGDAGRLLQPRLPLLRLLLRGAHKDGMCGDGVDLGCARLLATRRYMKEGMTVGVLLWNGKVRRPTALAMVYAFGMPSAALAQHPTHASCPVTLPAVRSADVQVTSRLAAPRHTALSTRWSVAASCR